MWKKYISVREGYIRVKHDMVSSSIQPFDDRVLCLRNLCPQNTPDPTDSHGNRHILEIPPMNDKDDPVLHIF